MSCTCVSDPSLTCIIHPNGSPMTPDEFRSALPDKMKKSVNRELIDKINKVLADPDMYETYRDNFLSYGQVMAEGKFKLPNYIDAVVYVSHKLMGRTNIDAYSRTFPEKIERFTKQGVESKDIASYVTAYNKSKLVMLLMEQTLTPFHVLNQAERQRALQTQVDIMTDPSINAVARTAAANSVLTHTAPPPNAKLELQVTHKNEGDSVIDKLHKATQELVAQQKQAIQAGSLTAQDVAHKQVEITDAEYEEVPDVD